jgi:hypothetical protein
MTSALPMKKTMGIVGLVALVAALVAAAFLTQAGPRTAAAADHLDAPGITPPPGGDGIGTDLTDIYAFQSPSDPMKTVLIMDVNGLTTGDLADPPGDDRAFGSALPKVDGDAAVTYNFRIDSNGDATADKTIQVAFGKAKKDGSQKLEVNIMDGKGKGRKDRAELKGRSTGFGESPVVNEEKGIKAFAGRRDDPFFFDLLGFLNILGAPSDSLLYCGAAHTASDTFAGQNVSSIVLEVPSKMLTAGGNPNIGVWATTNVGDDQIDRMGRPAINTVFIPNNPFPPDRASDGKSSKKTTFNHGDPSTDVAMWNDEVVDTLTFLFSINDGTDPNPGDDAAQIAGLAAVLLPDILTVDVSNPAGFVPGLNGRQPADDVIDAELGIITEGEVTTDCVDSNDVAFPSTFPYLAAPH